MAEDKPPDPDTDVSIVQNVGTVASGTVTGIAVGQVGTLHVHLVSQPPEPTPRQWTGETPYPGLLPFEETQARFFCGRDAEVERILLAVREKPFVLVVGASGSGKSSLIRAGAVPRLAAIPGATTPPDAPWLYARLRPGNDPVTALANALEPLCVAADLRVSKEIQALKKDPTHIGDLAHRLLAHQDPSACLLLYVDQFEELFEPDVAAESREALVAALVAAARTDRIRTIATMRAEFMRQCLDLGHDSPLGDLVTGGTDLLTAPGGGSVRSMIVDPATAVGVAVDDPLVTRIQDDLGDKPDNLVLLAFALRWLFDRREAPEGMSLADYNSAFGSGGLRGAIGARAEQVVADIAADDTTVEAVLQTLVTVGDETQAPIRVRASMVRVNASAESAALVNAMVEAGLLVTDQAHRHGAEPVVEVAHEALFTHWPRLATWIEQHREYLVLKHRIIREARVWDQTGDYRYLWLHEQQAMAYEALTALGESRAALGEPATSFLRPESERLLEELDDLDTSHYRRAEIGDRLDRIGDPRPGVGMRPDGLPDIAWCDVEAGTVMIGTRSNKVVSAQKGSGQSLATIPGLPFYVERRVLIDSDPGRQILPSFQISIYPVTYTQYKAFLAAEDGYRNRRWWRHPTRLGGGQDAAGDLERPVGNRPAESVCWFDAVAFCRWFTYRLREVGSLTTDKVVRLPTEGEWQAAAVGYETATEYPWGPEWDHRRVNSYLSRLSRSTAVGMYPAGTARSGAMDMVGNVPEWTLSTFSGGSNEDLASIRQRVVRGGSFLSFQNDCSALRRAAANPGEGDAMHGFRMVRASPISGSH